MNRNWHLVALTAVLSTLSYLAITPLTFLSSDVGLRYLQIEQIIAQHWQTLAIPYNTQVDPTWLNVPYYYAYSLLNNELYFNISPFFPLLTAVFTTAIGKVGLIVLPVGGALLTAWGVYRLATLCNLPFAPWLLWTAVFATPLIFYALQLWDHTLATGLASAALACIATAWRDGQRRSTWLGGLLLGLALHQRPELYVFAVALGLGLIIVKRPLAEISSIVVGALLASLPLWALNYGWVGHPLGMGMASNLLGYGVPSTYPTQPAGFSTVARKTLLLLYVEPRNPVTLSATLFALSGIILLVFALRLPRYRHPIYLWGGVVLSALAYASWGSIGWYKTVTGLISTLPLLPLALAYVQNGRSRQHTTYQITLFTGLIFVGLMLLLWPAFGGTQWGARYMLPAYPLLILAAAYAFHHYRQAWPAPLARTLTAVTLSLVAISILLQLVGVRLIFASQAEQIPARALIDQLPAHTIITDNPFTPSLMTSLDKQFFYAETEADLTDLLQRSAASGITQVALLALRNDIVLIMPPHIPGYRITPTSPNVYQLEPISND